MRRDRPGSGIRRCIGRRLARRRWSLRRLRRAMWGSGRLGGLRARAPRATRILFASLPGLTPGRWSKMAPARRSAGRENGSQGVLTGVVPGLWRLVRLGLVTAAVLACAADLPGQAAVADGLGFSSGLDADDRI